MTRHDRPGSPACVQRVALSRRCVAAARVALATLLLAAASFLGALPQGASPVLAEGPGDWQVWLDGPIPSDPPPGSALHIGFIAWDAHEHSTVNMYGFEVRLHPATGKSAEAVADVSQDWPGHSAADIVVPPGGLGRLEFGILWGDVSRVSRSVTLDFRPVPVAGVGPPPSISLRLIGTVRPMPSAPVVAGQPFDVDLTFEPKVSWPSASLPLPDDLTLRVRSPGADASEDVPATLVDPPAARYRATVVVDRPGPYVLEAAMEPDAPPADRFTESEVRVVAAAPAGPPTPATPTEPGVAGPTSPPDQGLPVPLLVLAGLALVGGTAWVVRFLRQEW